jgi:hypothetical protein
MPISIVARPENALITILFPAEHDPGREFRTERIALATTVTSFGCSRCRDSRHGIAISSRANIEAEEIACALFIS